MEALIKLGSYDGPMAYMPVLCGWFSMNSCDSMVHHDHLQCVTREHSSQDSTVMVLDEKQRSVRYCLMTKVTC